MKHALPPHIKPAYCVTCHTPTLESARATLSAQSKDEALVTLSLWMTPRYAGRHPKEVLTVCVALVEHRHYAEVISTLVYYLSVHTQDSEATGLLALTLLLSGEVEEAEIVIHQALTYIAAETPQSSQQHITFEGMLHYIQGLKSSGSFQVSSDTSSDELSNAQHFDDQTVDMTDSETIDLSELVFAQSHPSETLQDQQMSQLLKMVELSSQEIDPLDDSTVTLSPSSQIAVDIDRSDTMINASAIDLDYGLDYGLDESKVTEIINRDSGSLEEEAATNDTQQNLIQSLPTSVLHRDSRESSRKHLADDSELYVFDEDLLSELGLSSVRDAQDDTSEIDSSILQQLEQFTQQIDWDDATDSSTLTKKHELEQPPIKRDLVEYGDTDRFVISEFEGALISDDDSLTASNTELIDQTLKVEPILDPLLYPFATDGKDDVHDLLVGGDRDFVDLATTPWLKPEKPSSAPKVQIYSPHEMLEPLSDRDDDVEISGTLTSLDSPPVSIDSFALLHEEEVRTAHQKPSLTPRYLAPSDLSSSPPALSSSPPALSSSPPALSNAPQDMSEFSALRRLAEGELNLDTFPNPIPSSSRSIKS